MFSGLRSRLYGGTAPEREDSSVKRAKYKSATEFFEDMVLRWSLEDIMNENLFKDEVKYIPERFESVKEYLGSFITPLIEETRAELHNTLKSISEAPNAAVNFTERIRPSKGAVVEYKMLIDREYDMGEREGKQSLIPKPKDILILSSRVPQYVEDLRDYMLAVVSRTEFQCEDTDGKNQDSNMLEVRAYVPDMHPFCSQNSNTEDKIFGIYVGHLSANLRIWRALLTDLDDQTNWTIMLDKAVHCNREDSNEALVEENENDIERFRSKHFESHKLNFSQISALVSAVNAVKNKEHPCIKLIQGPPGAGKTSMLVSLLSVLLHRRYRVLVCAHTNAAISEIAMRFLNVVRSPSDQCPNTDNSSCIVTSSDLVLVGNEERLNVEGHLGNIFLECRMNRLKGWRKIVTYLLDFLESAISQYEAQQKDAINFLQFIRESLEKLASDFFNSAKILLNDYPGSISEKQNLACLFKVVEHFVNLIQENALEEKSLRECFSGNGEFCKEASECTANFREESLCSSRSECMHFLKRELSCERTLPNQDILKLCLSRAKVVFSTVSSSGKKYMNLAAPFDCLIIDEAAQLKEAESTIALQIAGITHAFMIGDPKQLPATVISKLAEKMNYGRSLFERLEKLGHSVHILDIQYRMHPWISLFPNREFYDNSIKNGPNVEVEPYGYTYLTSEMYGAYKFINVAGGREEEDEFGMSKRNIIEAVVVKYILSKLYKVCSCRGNSISVGVVSPYREQVLYLDRKLSTIKDEWKNILDVEVQSVDGFQGGEKDIIIISTVRTGKKIGFLSDDRRTNVALTRARFCLWIIGHGPSLLQSNSVWTKIVKDAKLRKCFLDSSMDPKIAEVIRKAKAKLDQLEEDLLNKDSVLFNNTVWKVLFSNEFKKSFPKIKRLEVRQRILGTILNMANGWRKTMKYGGHSEENLINEYSISGLYLLWSTDVQKGTESLQVLKIWNVLRLEEVPHFRTRLEKIFGTYTPQYIERCKAKVFDRERKFLLPGRWEDDHHFVWYRDLQQPEISGSSQCNPSESVGVPLEHAKVEESLLLMKFYSLSSGIANQLLTAQDGSEIDLQFEVNDEESRVIRFPRSLFILGRSGTGKTTVLVIRLLQKEQQAKLSLHGLSCHRQNEFQVEERNERREGQQVDLNGSNIKQMFVTVSAKLCSAIRSNIARVDRSALGKDQDTFMAMHERSDGLSELQNIPDSFIDIPNKNFPLVITFRKFLMMLDGTVKDHFSDGPMRSTNRKSRAFEKIMRTREVDYDRFESMYWPHFNADLKRGLDSSVVFTEIISHIKGSLISLNSSNFIMSQKDYILMADCQISTLNVSQREAIYDLFLLYEKKKKTNGDFDIADIVNHLHRQLRCNTYLGQKLDFIYVDEVQDLTISQITLLKYVCSNVHEGYVFAGDTAQTIARGVSFRFQEIRNLYYREFLAEDGKNDLSSKNSMADLFHLCQNFRTHTGIIKLAQSVMDLLYHFFPFAVDKLPPETSLIFGEAPILLGGNVITELFGGNPGTATAEGGINFGRGKYEFGAEQVILVRDDHAKEQVLGQVGQQSLVLTITECKGLEFQDVLLYNFFTSSPLGSKWRVIYEFFNQVTLNNFNQKRHPKFDNSKHILICSELKYLYVAITRAKQRLWIQEENHEYSVLDYWKEKGLAQWKNLDRSFVDSLCVVSSRVDWKQRGIQMFHEKLYDTAIVCFEKAMYSDSKIAKWAKAASLQQSGQRLLERDPEAAKKSLREAAECYLSIEKPDLAADCFIIMGDYKEADVVGVDLTKNEGITSTFEWRIHDGWTTT